MPRPTTPGPPPASSAAGKPASYLAAQSRASGRFRLRTDFTPQGDQEQAIGKLVAGLNEGRPDQVLLGVTGSGKTFTIAKVIEAVNRPDPRPLPQQDPRRAALPGVPELLPRELRRVLRLLLRLLPARGLHPADRHLHREGRPRATRRSTSCASRRRRPSSSGATSSSWPRSPASTASARPSPTTTCSPTSRSATRAACRLSSRSSSRCSTSGRTWTWRAATSACAATCSRSQPGVRGHGRPRRVLRRRDREDHAHRSAPRHAARSASTAWRSIRGPSTRRRGRRSSGRSERSGSSSTSGWPS